MKIVTRRKPGDPMSYHIRSYATYTDAVRARTQLIKRGFNYFVHFLNAGSPALAIGVVNWMSKGSVHIDR